MISETFHPGRVDLAAGTTLIEASAGTGKTYSIAALFLRFVLEEGLPVGKILAVTFGVAATRELKDRIRARLRDTLEAFRSGCPEAEEATARTLASGGSSGEAIRRLQLALHSFDEAPIFTIHGFCQRMLTEHAFESGARYDAGQTVPHPRPLLEEVAADFWRSTFYPAPPLLAALAADGQLPSATALADLLGQRHPGVRILPEPGLVPLAELRTALETAFAPLAQAWAAEGPALADLLATTKDLSHAKGKPFHPETVAIHAAALDRLADGDAPDPATLAALAAFCDTTVSAHLNKNKTAPRTPFLTLSDAFAQAVAAYRSELPHTFLAYAGAELEARKLSRRVVTFDDLLTRLHTALHGPGGNALAGKIGAAYQAVLLDEFQDTDPVQAEIFRRLFAGGAHQLYLIGDPKQAIYGFRGADLFAYLTAAREAQRRYHLGVNWRSTARLLEGLNALFTQVEHPFVLPGVAYHPVAPAPGQLPEGEPPLRFREVALEEGATQSLANPALARAVAVEIAHLRAAGCPLGEMAVLVRKGWQALMVQEALREVGVRSVRQTEENVFASPEAAVLQRFLEAVLEPRREAALRGALLTPLLGLSAQEVAALEDDEPAREAWLERFAQWRVLWLEEGFMAVFRHALVEARTRERLVREPGGERSLTNYLHLAELLHTAETTRRLAPATLQSWLWQQRSAPEAPETGQLRLESDDEAVEIVTIHKSKGLEYPLVFCPFVTSAALNKKGALHFHDTQGQACLELRPRGEAPPEHEEANDREQLAEEVRLLYVALTRAKRGLYLYHGAMKEAGQSALAYLFPDGDLAEGIARLVAACPTAISNSPAPDAPPPAPPPAPAPALAARTFGGTLAWQPFTTSFTGLTAGTGHEEPERDLPADDDTLEPVEPSGIHAFPKGAAAGDFFHDVLEHADFTTPTGWEPLIVTRLARHGFAHLPMAGAVQQTLEETFATELAPGLRLANVPPAQRLSEATFFCRLPRLTPADLAGLVPPEEAALAELGEREWGRLRFAPVHGYLRGAIDLLFEHEGRYYLADWKSNWLGPRPQDYDAPGLARAMRAHHYALQANLYVLAADRFLAQRLPGYDYETHFGGVFYLFLRGMSRTHPERGVCRLRPTLAQVERLRRLVLTP